MEKSLQWETWNLTSLVYQKMGLRSDLIMIEYFYREKMSSCSRHFFFTQKEQMVTIDF